MKETGRVIFVMSLPIIDLRMPCVASVMNGEKNGGQIYPKLDLGPVISVHGKLLSRPVFVALESCSNLRLL